MKRASKLQIALAFAVVYVVWGSTYLAIRIGLGSMPPLLMGGVRFLIAGALLWAWCEARGEARANREQVRNAALAGIAMVSIGNGLVTWAEQSVPSGLTALIVAVGPLVTVLMMWARRQRGRPDAATVAGLALGLVGVGLLLFGTAGGSVDPLGALAIVLATVGWSWGALHTQHAAMPASVLRSNALQMLVGGAVVFGCGLLRGETRLVHLDRVTASSWWALAYLILFGSIAAYTTYQWLLRQVSAAAAGTTAYVNPAVAVLLGGLWGETIGPRAILAMVLILAGVYLLKRGDAAPKPVLSTHPKPSEA